MLVGQIARSFVAGSKGMTVTCLVETRGNFGQKRYLPTLRMIVGDRDSTETNIVVECSVRYLYIQDSCSCFGVQKRVLLYCDRC